MGVRPSQGTMKQCSPVVPQARPAVVIKSNETLLVRTETQLASHFELENELQVRDVTLHEPEHHFRSRAANNSLGPIFVRRLSKSCNYSLSKEGKYVGAHITLAFADLKC